MARLLSPNQGNAALTNTGRTEELLGLCPLLLAEIQCQGGPFSLPSTRDGVLAIQVFLPRVPWEPSSEAGSASARKSCLPEVLVPAQVYTHTIKRIPSTKNSVKSYW